MRKIRLAGIGLAFFSLLCLPQSHWALSPAELIIIRQAAAGSTSACGLTGTASPLEKLTIANIQGESLRVADAAGYQYFASPCQQVISFTAGGKLGKHTITVTDKKGKVMQTASFTLDAQTAVNDGGQYTELFDILNHTMRCYAPDGTNDQRIEGRNYEFFVPWVLDNNNVAKGMKYFSPAARDMVDLFCAKQRPNGMIWSFVDEVSRPGYYATAYGPYGYSETEGNVLYVRQPVENHVEYNFVNLMYQHWQSSGDNTWMAGRLDCAARALDYCVTDPLRWSSKYQLLVRPYTIDSWDFQIDDEYTPDIGINKTMMADAKLSKLGVFFGDNTGYIQACHELAKMYRAAGQTAQADKYDQRGRDILQRLNALAWNGRFFTHRIEEDTTLTRDLGVDEKTLIGHSNAYSINRGISHEQNVAIINTYIDLKNNLPKGSPGEWYAIYPPFERGFGSHNTKWQYMNAGIAGHAAGELARGAYENGYEAYGTDILARLHTLGMENNKSIYFAYTGAYPDPVKPTITPVDISAQANMSLLDHARKPALTWMHGEKDNDLRNLPLGDQTFEGINFRITDPAKNNDKSTLAVSAAAGYPRQLSVPVNHKAACVYLLQTSSKTGPDNIAGSLSIVYTDGTSYTRYMVYGKQLSGWWFPSLKTDYSGIAWHGENPKSRHIGLSWTAIDNPNPEKTIRQITIGSSLSEGLYTVVAMSLSDQPHYVKPPLISFGGPDNWSGANAMAALVEGLAGVKDRETRFDHLLLSPRWVTTGSDTVACTIRYAASDGYAAYRYTHDKANRKLSFVLTASGSDAQCHILMPAGIDKPVRVTVDNANQAFTVSTVEKSVYADFTISPKGINTIEVYY